MNYKEASDLIKEINPDLAVPTHYTEVGSKDDALNFKNELEGFTEVKILM